jgi:branched-chain amino acid transport system substrate-binding protein
MRRISTIVLVSAVALASAACGSRLSHSRLLADATAAGSGGTGGSGGDTAGTSSDAGVAGRQGLTAQSGSAGSSSGSAAVSGGSIAGNGSGGAASGGTASGGAGATASCRSSLSPVVIGSVGEISGVVGQDTVEGTVGVQTWVASINARGGLHCHPVKYITLDDGGDPSRNQALTAQLVETNKAIAMVFEAAPLAGNASVNYLNQHQVPAIGSEFASAWFYTSPMHFPQGTSGVDDFGATWAAMAKVELPKGHSKLATISCVEASLCSQAYTLAPTLSARFGLTLVYRAQASLTQPDYTANCQAAKNAGADMFYLGMDTNSVERIARSCASIGYRPVFAIANLVTLPSLSSEPLLDGLISAQNTAPWFDTGNPGVAEFQKALARYAPGHVPSASGMAGWVSAKLFEQATKDISEPPSSKGVLQGLWGMNGADLGGLAAPLTYHQGQDNPQAFCYWIAQIQGGKFVSPNNSQRVCA